MAAQRIIILAKEAGRYKAALWFDVPASRQSFYAQAGKRSVWIGAQTTDNDAIAAGAVIEELVDVALPPGATIAQIQAGLEAQWTARQAEISDMSAYNRYGSRWNGTAWTAGSLT